MKFKKSIYTIAFSFLLTVLLSAKANANDSLKVTNRRMELISDIYGKLKFFYPGYAFDDGKNESSLVHLVQLALEEKSQNTFTNKLCVYLSDIAPGTKIIRKDSLNNYLKLNSLRINQNADTLVYWQHFGYGEGTNKPYRSVRVNRDKIDTSHGQTKGLPFTDKVLFNIKPQADNYQLIKLSASLFLFIPLVLTKYEVNFEKAHQPHLYKNSSNTPDYVELAGLVKTHAVMKYFYPYYKLLDKKPCLTKDLIADAIRCKDEGSYKKLLEKYLSQTNDGHSVVTDPRDTLFYCPLKFYYYRHKIFILRAFDSSLTRYQGSGVLKINGKSVKEYIRNKSNYISAASSRQKTDFILKDLVKSNNHSDLDLIIETNGSKERIRIPYNKTTNEYPYINTLMPGIIRCDSLNIYLNSAYFKTITTDSVFELLKQYKKIIVDLRGYPYLSTLDFILELMKVNDSISDWLKFPKIMYPEPEKNSFFETGWLGNKPEKERTIGKIAFLMNEECMSFAESCLSFIKYYKLGVLIGKPSGGMNGDVNTIILPNGFQIRFTGLKADLLDGKQLFGKGIKPDIIVKNINLYNEKNIQELFNLF